MKFSARLLLPVLTTMSALVAGVLLVPPASAASGSPLSVSRSALAASLTCRGDLAGAAKRPVLLVPGTTLLPSENYDWNYEKVFTAQGRPWCAVTLPKHAMGNIAVAGEYVVNAIRTMHRRADRKISIVGFSQGGMVPRWALKWWPDTRRMVVDMIGLDPSNHGTLDAYPACAIGGCAPAFWQQQSRSRFLRALNAGAETWAGISYTQVYTATDEVVVPNFGPRASSRLDTGAGRRANISVQSICPVHVSDHLSMGTSDPVGYALVQDALTHAGPASAARIPRTVCLRDAFPGINRATYPANFARVLRAAGTQALTAQRVPAEPPLPAYAR